MGNETTFAGPVILRRYSIPNEKGQGWGIFVIGSDGYFSVVSDYGNYAYWWSHTGMEFRAFLVRPFDADYLAGKLLAQGGEVYDEERTTKSIKVHILESRRTGGWKKERAAKEWELLSSYGSSLDEHSFHDWYNHTKIDDAYEFHRESLPDLFVGFAKVLFPRFQAVLRAELSSERAPEVANVG